ncbi:MAG: TolC family outer membrane protein [Sulfuritalea sp.]|nr:TolC family outer membrane protein [Sulfuritalea sp.]
MTLGATPDMPQESALATRRLEHRPSTSLRNSHILANFMRSRLRNACSIAGERFISWVVRPKRRGYLCALVGLIYGAAGLGACHAQSLSSLLELARRSEPTYLSARTNVQAASARTDQAVGAMLPQVTASANTNTNIRDYETLAATSTTEHGRYNSNSTQVNFTQPLWRYANVAGWQQAQAVQDQAQHQLAGAELELVAKLVTAWLDVLAARDGVLFTGQQAAAAQRQWEIIRRGAELGASSQPQVEEARAKYDQALSDAELARTEGEIKQAALEQLVGPLRQLNPPFMRERAVLADVSKEKMETWLSAAETGSPFIMAATKAYEAADAEVRKQSAGHQPTLDLVLNYSRNRQAVGGFPGQAGYDVAQNAVGLQLNVPIFSGGTQSAKVDEAVAQKEKARLDIEAARRATVFAVKQAWYGWHSAYARARAGAQAVQAAQAALALARRGRANGLKTDLDVLQAEQQMHAAQRDFRKGRYDQVVAHVKLKAVAGALSTEDVMLLDALFTHSPDEPETMVQGSPSVVVARQ